jgi:hypothetical protein
MVSRTIIFVCLFSLQYIFFACLFCDRGLKGTSKPVFYRCIWNENFMYRQEANHSQLHKTALENVTFGLSFQYGTASKATRSMSVIYYAERMANAGLSCARAIRARQSNGALPDGIFPSWKRQMPTSRSYHIHQTAWGERNRITGSTVHFDCHLFRLLVLMQSS